MKLDNSPIFYEVIPCGGDRPWVCFLHAAFVDHRMFQSQVDHFASSFNILSVDILGHGKSVDTRKGDDVAMMSGWLRDILDAEGIPKLHLVGISLGAVLAQDFANHFPDRVNSLACFGGYDINNFDMKLQRENGAAQMGMMLKAVFSLKWFAQANKKISAYTEKAQQEFYELNLQFPKKSFMYLAGLGSMVNRCQTGVRPYPLLIGCGEQDIPMEHKAVDMWKAGEPTAQVVKFEGAGHCVNMDVPEKFNEVMAEFWNQI